MYLHQITALQWRTPGRYRGWRLSCHAMFRFRDRQRQLVLLSTSPAGRHHSQDRTQAVSGETGAGMAERHGGGAVQRSNAINLPSGDLRRASTAARDREHRESPPTRCTRRPTSISSLSGAANRLARPKRRTLPVSSLHHCVLTRIQQPHTSQRDGGENYLRLAQGPSWNPGMQLLYVIGLSYCMHPVTT